MSAKEKLKKIEEYLSKTDDELEKQNNEVGYYDHYENGKIVGAWSVVADIQEIIKGEG